MPLFNPLLKKTFLRQEEWHSLEQRVEDYREFEENVFEPPMPNEVMGLDENFDILIDDPEAETPPLTIPEGFPDRMAMPRPENLVRNKEEEGEPDFEGQADFDMMRSEIEEMLEEAESQKKEVEKLRQQVEEEKMNLQLAEDEANKQAEEIEAGARKKAEEIEAEAQKKVEEAQHRVEEIEAQAYQKGFEQGEEAGRQMGMQKMEVVARNLGHLLEEARKQRDGLFAQAQQELVQLAHLIALKTLHRELRQDPSVILDVVKAALGKIRQGRAIRVRVSPMDYKFLQPFAHLLDEGHEGEWDIQLEQSNQLGRGQCRVVCESGAIEADIMKAVETLQNYIYPEGMQAGHQLATAQAAPISPAVNEEEPAESSASTMPEPREGTEDDS